MEQQKAKKLIEDYRKRILSKLKSPLEISHSRDEGKTEESEAKRGTRSET